MAKLGSRDAQLRARRSLAGVDSRDFSEALARGLRIIESFDRDHRRMTLAETARTVDLPRATVRRSLSTLVHLGYMTLDGREYQLASRVLGLATTYLDAGPSRVLQAACERLCADVGHVCSVAVLDGDAAVMIARAAPNQLLATGVGVGHRLPALRTSLGRVLLAGLDDTALEERLATAAPSDRRRLRSAVHAARNDGHAYADSEVTPGFRSIAVPLHRWDGRMIAANQPWRQRRGPRHAARAAARRATSNRRRTLRPTHLTARHPWRNAVRLRMVGRDGCRQAAGLACQPATAG